MTMQVINESRDDRMRRNGAVFVGKDALVRDVGYVDLR